jgi:mitochondrial distribution and morphology protein 31
VWIILGTTTFFSLAILLVNTVFAQETLAKWVGESLTKSSGIHVVFESAIVPKWGDGVISFSNVYVSRRPGQGKAKVTKGSQAQLAAAAANVQASEKAAKDEDEGNYTQFDVSIQTVNVSLSFAKWFNGKGLLRDVEMKGIRGVIDRTHVQENGPWPDPRSWRREHNPGDFEIDSFKLDDLLLTVYQPNGFRPFPISIYNCDLPQLRQQWIFYDLMSANNMSGSIDNSLFTLHPRQMHNHTGLRIDGTQENGDAVSFKKQSRLRIDGLNIDHLNRGVDGPFSWIREGNVDIVADISFPADDDDSVAKVISDVFDRVEATVTTNSIPTIKSSTDIDNQMSNNASGIKGQSVSAIHQTTQPTGDDNRVLIMDLRIHLNDVRAGVPIFTKDISYVNNALIRPIVAYINSRRAFIPVNCRVVKRKSEFDGSWTFFDSGMLDDLNREVSRYRLAGSHGASNIILTGLRCLCPRYPE